jgi:hypothetical protein
VCIKVGLARHSPAAAHPAQPWTGRGPLGADAEVTGPATGRTTAGMGLAAGAGFATAAGAGLAAAAGAGFAAAAGAGLAAAAGAGLAVARGAGLGVVAAGAG